MPGRTHTPPPPPPPPPPGCTREGGGARDLLLRRIELFRRRKIAPEREIDIDAGIDVELEDLEEESAARDLLLLANNADRAGSRRIREVRDVLKRHIDAQFADREARGGRHFEGLLERNQATGRARELQAQQEQDAHHIENVCIDIIRACAWVADRLVATRSGPLSGPRQKVRAQFRAGYKTLAEDARTDWL
jgi:hypothetical protein